MCSREDGLSSVDIAARAERPTRRSRARADSLDGALAALTLSTPLDEIIGPVRVDGEWCVMWVRARSAADPSDATVRETAIGALVDEAIDAHTRGRVTWHGPV
jgi:hypothetical protein